MSQVLEIANGGRLPKTRIIDRAFLSYGQLQEHPIFLTETDLLCYDEDTRTFKTTEKGLGFLIHAAK